MKIMGLVALVALGVCAIVLLVVRRNAKMRDSIREDNMRDEQAQEEFRQHIARYSGYCEPLHQSVRTGDADFAEKILEVWEGYMNKDGALLEMFHSTCGKSGDACAKGARWLQRLEGWGVGHDEIGDIVVVDGQCETRYFLGGEYEYGNHASVVQPSWYWVGESGGCIASGIAQVVDH